MAVHILIAVALAVAYLGSLYVRPFGKCWRCRGRSVVVRGHGKTRKCPVCKGKRRQQRVGSRTVHRVARMVRAELARTRKEHQS